jgi:hypothetical protein
MIDADGRIFGRMNAIDALGLLLVICLIPLAYGAWALFRTPVPTIQRVTVTLGEPVRVQLEGANLRPYLRVQVGSMLAPLMVASPTLAMVDLPHVAPGTYDLALFDEARLLVTQPHAVIIPASASVPIVRRTYTAAELHHTRFDADHELALIAISGLTPEPLCYAWFDAPTTQSVVLLPACPGTTYRPPAEAP